MKSQNTNILLTTSKKKDPSSPFRFPTVDEERETLSKGFSGWTLKTNIHSLNSDQYTSGNRVRHLPYSHETYLQHNQSVITDVPVTRTRTDTTGK